MIFTWHGVSETVLSDNGPQYTSQEFAEFSEAYNFKHITSSPLFSQSNGQAEHTLKNPLRKSTDPHMVLLTCRSTQFKWCSLSPAELLIGRRLRTNIPLVRDQLVPDWKFLDKCRHCNQDFKNMQKYDHDHRHKTQPLGIIPDDSDVWITTDSQRMPGQVVLLSNTPQSYLVNSPTGPVRRNRLHLNQVPNNCPATDYKESNSISPSNVVQTWSRTGTIIHPPDRLWYHSQKGRLLASYC